MDQTEQLLHKANLHRAIVTITKDIDKIVYHGTFDKKTTENLEPILEALLKVWDLLGDIPPEIIKEEQSKLMERGGKNRKRENDMDFNTPWHLRRLNNRE